MCQGFPFYFLICAQRRAPEFSVFFFFPIIISFIPIFLFFSHIFAYFLMTDHRSGCFGLKATA